MSSDSDDEYSYTNSVSVLKALTRHQTSFDSELKTSKTDNCFFDTSEIEEQDTKVKTRSERLQEEKAEDELLQSIDLDKIVEKGLKNINDSCIVLSDAEQDITPINIISAIDNVLMTSKERRKRKGPGKAKIRSKRLKKNTRKQIQTPILNNSEICIIEDTPDINEVNYELTIKVYWMSQKLEKFSMRRFDKLTNIFQYFAEKESVPENRLLFTIKDKIISKTDTPDSINITAASIIEGGILSAKSNFAEVKDIDRIELKVQMKDRKKPLLISLRPDDKMEILMCKCATELKIPMKNLKFYFDGDLIKSSETPEDLDLEGDEIIDCINK